MRTELEIDLDLDLDRLGHGVVLCIAPHGLPAHQAQWYAKCPCGHSTPICDLRRRILFNEGGWKCSIGRGGGCTLYHPWDVMEFFRI